MAEFKRRKVLDELMRGMDAAKMLGVSRPTVLAMIARDELRSEKVGGLIFVLREDVERLASERQSAA